MSLESGHSSEEERWPVASRVLDTGYVDVYVVAEGCTQDIINASENTIQRHGTLICFNSSPSNLSTPSNQAHSNNCIVRNGVESSCMGPIANRSPRRDSRAFSSLVFRKPSDCKTCSETYAYQGKIDLHPLLALPNRHRPLLSFDIDHPRPFADTIASNGVHEAQLV